MDSTKLKKLLSETKNQFNKVETQVIDLKSTLDDNQRKLIEIEEKKLKEENLVKNNQNKLVVICVSGEEFTTTIKSLLRFKESLFYNIVINGMLEEDSSVYIDRPPFLFPNILDYLRFGKLNLVIIRSNGQLQNLREEASYYNLKELVDSIDKFLPEVNEIIVKISGFEISDGFYVDGKTICDYDLNTVTLKEKTNPNSGICTGTQGWITFSLENSAKVTRIEIKGFHNDRYNFDCENGRDAAVLVSQDKRFWWRVGVIPRDFGSELISFNIEGIETNYVKLASTSSPIGVSFIRFFKS